jgi:hypothetical protein
MLESIGVLGLLHATTSFSRLPSTKERRGEVTYLVNLE